MKKIRSSDIAKLIAYILVPILFINILVNAFSIIYCYETNGQSQNAKNYFETDMFSERYFNAVRQAVIMKADNKEINEKNMLSLEEAKKEIEYGCRLGTKTYEILIVTKDGKAYTNIEKTTNTDSLEKLKAYIKDKEAWWIYENNKVITDIGNLQFDKIAYDSRFITIQDTECDVYACLESKYHGDMYLQNVMYKTVGGDKYVYAPTNIVISGALLAIFVYFIIISIGHKKDEEGIYTNILDKIPFEIISALEIFLLFVEACILNFTYLLFYEITDSNLINACLLFFILTGIAIYATLAVFLVTFIRRIKAKVFWKNTVIYMFFDKISNFIKKNIEIIGNNLNTNAKIICIFICFTIIQMFCLIEAIFMGNFIFIFVLLLTWIFACKVVVSKLDDLLKLRNKIKKMYEGDVDGALQEDDLKGELKQVSNELNDIAGGLSNAIEEAMKSERLKTELITNVSHDIKTPLTSIINYVDLMKQENIENEKVKEYLEVLDNKSQRLKKLTEDLVEASKASSGNIKLTIEKLNLKELIKQVSGEFEEKFKEKGLQIIETLPEEEMYIEADSKYMFRVMENIYVNISKYALENSRVYIDLVKQDNIVKIELKNISKEKLNISVDELMQRFVRGDASRTTEGSGLGISIAKSLTELQQGKFDIYLDGDLFKVILEFKIV